ncbi:hypothetical protein [Streptacidiphilus rugosus]|uniref:hypothetical protein n=1 Tax=Streptacidiphilus rugosus TaxID=405783 RepID=UPI00055E02DF|nr:hypothetical protein [Streptacidiphilus rugosus]
MTDTTLVRKAAEALPASTGAHMHRAAVLLAVLQRLDDPALPEIATWSSECRTYRDGALGGPALTGLFAGYFQIERAREAVRAWAAALGTTMTERYIEDHGRRVELHAAAEVDGVLIQVGHSIGVYDRCPGCGGPAIGDTVLRHYTDAPCAGARALQA